MKTALFVMLALLSTSHVQAQETSEIPRDISGIPIVSESDLRLDGDQHEALTRWIKDVRNYQAWYKRYRGRVAKNVFGYPGERRQIPAVLPWLPAKCEQLADFVRPPAGLLADGCAWLAYYRTDFTVEPAAQQALFAQQQSEQTPHWSFWKHVHLDGGWTSLDPRMNTYGLIGVHVTLPEIAKRIQVYLPPGFLLLSVPDGNGGREFQPAATVGVSIKMFAFEFPQNKRGTAFFNLAKAYIVGRGAMATTTSGSNSNGSVDLIGLSFAWGQ